MPESRKFGTHWTASRKAAVIMQIRDGELAREAALARYQLSEEELQAWERDLDAHGLGGLAVYKKGRKP